MVTWELGVKLPTGFTGLANEDGEQAERSLQPGSGVAHLLLGANYSAALSGRSSWFLATRLTQALGSSDNFRPGRELSASLGLSSGIRSNVWLLLQGIAQYKAADTGAAAESENSGSTQFFAAPGLAVRQGNSVALYGMIQIPIRQRVAGTQLTADWGLMAGLRYGF